MILLHPHPDPDQAASKAPPVIALFGVGLIGSAIRDSLLGLGYTVEVMPLDWDDSRQQEHDLEAIRERLASRITDESLDCRFIWSAGKAGFASDDRETQLELDSYRRVLALAESFLHSTIGRSPFMMVGSVGGLFEGQRHIGSGSIPRARRPYGRLKLEQESLLARSDSLMGRVYRLTSVFGPSGAGRRKGLVSTLVENCFRHETTRIVGNASTLRDFVWSRDIGEYIARDTASFEWEPDCAIQVLGSGKPASIFEIIGHVESATGLKAWVRYEAKASNSRDISLASSVLPEAWHPTDLSTAIRRTCLEMTCK